MSLELKTKEQEKSIKKEGQIKCELIQTCKNRFFGFCKVCKRDYNPKNHPNNYDCPNHRPIFIHAFYVKENNPSVRPEHF